MMARIVVAIYPDSTQLQELQTENINKEMAFETITWRISNIIDLVQSSVHFKISHFKP